MLRNIVFFLVFLLAAAFFGLYDAEMPGPDPLKIEAGYHERFWQLKARSPRRADVVLTGNSRVNQGVSPAALIAELPGEGWTGRNLAFNASGLNSTLFEFVEGRLDLESPRPAILVIGITPSMLTSAGAENAHLESLLSRPWWRAKAFIHFPRLAGLLSREEPPPEVKLYPGQNEYHDDGWQAVLREMNRRPNAWLKSSRRLFTIDRIRPELYQGFMEQLERWSDQGILVFGFVPPTSPAMETLERELAGFDARKLAEDFIGHGGLWIEIDPAEYRNYDNSHLPRAEALKLSRKLGREISRVLSARF